MSKQISHKAMMQALGALRRGLPAKYPPWQSEEDLVETAHVWRAVLADCSEGEVRDAVYSLLATAKQFPAVADLRAEVLAMRDEDDGLPTAVECWGAVERAISRDGRNRSPQLPAPLLEAVNAIGWTNICDADLSSLPTLRAQLREAYGAALTRHRRRQATDLAAASTGLPAAPSQTQLPSADATAFFARFLREAK